MSPGVGFPSVAVQAAWTASGLVAGYPASNLSDLFYPSCPARAAAAGAVSFSFALPAPSSIQLVALIGHSAGAGASMRVRLFAEAVANPSNVPLADTGTVLVWPTGSAPVAGYAASRPVVLSSPVTAQSGIVDVSDSAGPVSIGAIELASWWRWRGIGFGRYTGIDSQTPNTTMVGGTSLVSSEYAPRVVNGSIPSLALGSETNTAMDFQHATDIIQPFLFLMDADTPASWARHCFLASNSQIQPLTGIATKRDSFNFSFTEYWR